MLTTQDCNNIVMYHDCVDVVLWEQPCNMSDNINKIVTTVNSLFQTC
jgi:hypothetical protein